MAVNQQGLTWHDQVWSWWGNRDKSITYGQTCVEGTWKGQWARAKEVRGIHPLTQCCRVRALLVKIWQRSFWPLALPSISCTFYPYTNNIQYKWSPRFTWGKHDLSWNTSVCTSKQDTQFMLCPVKGPRSTYRNICIQLSPHLHSSSPCYLLQNISYQWRLKEVSDMRRKVVMVVFPELFGASGFSPV